MKCLQLMDVTHSVWPSIVPIQTTNSLCFHIFLCTKRRWEDKLINHKINKLWLVAGCLECIHMPILYTHCLCCGLIYLVTMPWSHHTSEMKRTWPCSNIWSHQQTVKHLKTTAHHPIYLKKKKENNFKKKLWTHITNLNNKTYLLLNT